MKVALFNHQVDDKPDKITQRSGEKRFEWLMFKAVLTFLIVLAAAQTALLYPSVRSSVSDYYIEGEPLTAEAYLFISCKMELKLINMSQCPGLKVLVNGSERAVFESNTILLELKDCDIVELDASNAPVLAKVQVTSVSENISGILGKVITASHGITSFYRVKTSG
ncbi:MAG: hypothetical protein ABFD25_01905 [Clostridiaceae bacterium]